MEIVPTVRNLSAYVDIIIDKQLVRNLIEVSGEIISEARETGAEGRLLLDSAEQQIYDIRQGRDAKGLVPVREAIYETYDRIRLLSGEDREKYLGIKTGYADVDRLTGGLNKTDLVLIAARPGMGKTSFALNIAANLGMRQNKKVAIFSLEMSTEQVTSRMLSSEAFVESRRLRMGELQTEDWTRLAEASQLLSKANILIDDTAGVTVSSIKAKLRRVRDLDLVVIDYLQLMSSGRRTDNRVQEVSEMTRNLKLMAKELNIPVIVLSQLSRATESRQGHKPMLSDLRESGSIEQDADLVMFLYRESYYQMQEGQAAPESDSVECIVSKNRHGETGSAFLRWDGQYTRFFTLEDR
jgi:replicative DNA helicase